MTDEQFKLLMEQLYDLALVIAARWWQRGPILARMRQRVEDLDGP